MTGGLCLFKYTQCVCNECHCQAFVGQNVPVDTVVISGPAQEGKAIMMYQQFVFLFSLFYLFLGFWVKVEALKSEMHRQESQ